MNQEFITKVAMWVLEQFSFVSNKNWVRIHYKFGDVSSGSIFFDFQQELIQNSIQNWPCELWSNCLWFPKRIEWEFYTKFAIWDLEEFSLVSNKSEWRIHYKIGHLNSGEIFFEFQQELIKNSIQNWPCGLCSNFLCFPIRIHSEFNTK